MSYRPSYSNGDWKSCCDRCGRLYKASSLRKEWNGLMTCDSCWEHRQPQDFVRGVIDNMTTPWNRREQSDTFISYCTSNTSRAVLAVAGCAIAGVDVDVPTVPKGTYASCSSDTSRPTWATAGCAVANSLSFNR
jgi:hypothetical protein